MVLLFLYVAKFCDLAIVVFPHLFLLTIVSYPREMALSPFHVNLNVSFFRCSVFLTVTSKAILDLHEVLSDQPSTRSRFELCSARLHIFSWSGKGCRVASRACID